MLRHTYKQNKKKNCLTVETGKIDVQNSQVSSFI